MKLLLDENLPNRLKYELPDFEVSTVVENGWKGKKNGELIKLLIKNNFNALITFDKNIQYQQNFKKYRVSLIVIHAKDNTFNTLKASIPELKKKIKKGLPKGPVEIRLKN